MKTNLFFLFCSLLLAAVACRNQDVAPQSANPNELATAGAPRVSLDSFQRTASALLPAVATANVPKNQLYIRREKDSVTFSGAVYGQDLHRALVAYRFYFKADARGCYAYVKHDRSSKTAGLRKLTSREAGYCLHFFRANQAG